MVEFQYRGLNFLFEHDPTDASFFRMLLPNIEPSNEINEDIRNNMIRVTTVYKMGKCLLVNENQVWMSVDGLSFSREKMEPVFQRMMDILCQMFRDYRTHGGQQQ